MKTKLIATLAVVSVLLVPLIALAASDECECTCNCPDRKINNNINQNQNTNQPPVYYSDQIIINEIFPNPDGSDSENEFIELRNLSSQDVDLAGWQVADSSKDYAIDQEDFNSTIIPARGYFVIYRTASSLALNNSGEEEVFLHQPNDSLLDEITYIGAEEAMSYGFDGEDWAWTVPTPGTENIFEEIIEEEPEEEEEPETNTNSNVNANQNINQPAEPEVSFSNQVFISEIFPNPEGSDTETEFIELYNSGEESVDLTGWKLSDATTKKYTLDGEIAPGEYLVVYRLDSKISLNNTDDQVELYWPDKELLQVVEYTDCQEDMSYSYQAEKWQWTDPTPGEKNASEEEPEESVQDGSEGKDVQLISSTLFDLPPNNKSRQILYGLLTGGAVALVAAGAVGTRYYKKKMAEK